MTVRLTWQLGFNDAASGCPCLSEYHIVDGRPEYRVGYTEYRQGYLEGTRTRGDEAEPTRPKAKGNTWPSQATYDSLGQAYARERAADSVNREYPLGEVQETLAKQGLSRKTAGEAARNVAPFQEQAHKAVSNGMIVEGVVICAIGLLATLLSYAFAPGRYYIIALGPILYGGWRIFQGLNAYTQPSADASNPLSPLANSLSSQITLEEAATALGRQVLIVSQAMTNGFLETLADTKDDTSSEKDKVSHLEIQADFLCLYSHLVDRIAVGTLGAERRNELMDLMFPTLAASLAEAYFGGSDEIRDQYYLMMFKHLDGFSAEFWQY